MTQSMGSDTGKRTDWDIITEIFREALELEASERAPFVEARCGGRSDVVDEVLELLGLHETSGSFLLELDSAKALSLLGENEEAELGHAGPFRLVREIGRGGMGVVYLGERSDGQFDHHVAVKVVKRGMDSDAIEARFLRERQILASLEHPNIARLYDGGVTESGQPYFAMEYVDGLPLTKYSDGHRLSIERRIELFAQGCQAVQYAHQNLVVHRDLKPSNMLVTGDGRVKLLDFGIAKVMGDASGDGSPITVTDYGQRILTPEYASPEQLVGRQVTTASDVYSLGVVLYELLSGHRPYSLGSLSPSEMERAVADSRISPPSSRLLTRSSADPAEGETDPLAEIASARSVPLARLRRRLRGDLDTIVMKALRTDPIRRYASAEGLLEDLRLHLSGQPIKARPESVWYRTSKFVLRNRVVVSIAAAVTALLLTSVVVSLDLADQRAQESSKAQQVTAFLTSILGSADPDQTRGEEVSLIEILDSGSKRIETELQGQPEVQAELMDVMATVYLRLGEYETAERLARSSLDLRLAVFGPRHELVARSHHRIGFALRGQARWEESIEFLERARELQLALLGPDHESLAVTLYDLAWIEAHYRGDYAAAEGLHRQAVAIFEKNSGYESEGVARGLYNIAWQVQRQGRYADARDTYRESLALWRKLVGDQHRSVAKNVSGLASAYQDLGELEEAERLFREALEIRRKVLAPDHPDMATSLNNLATALRDRGDHAGAASFFEEACSIYRSRLGPTHQFTSICEQNLGGALAGSGRWKEGIELLQRVLRTRIQRQGAEHPEIALTHVRLGDAFNFSGDHSQAERHFQTAFEIREKSLGEDHPETAQAQVSLATALLNLGRRQEALDLVHRALETLNDRLGADHPETVRATKLRESLLNGPGRIGN